MHFANRNEVRAVELEPSGEALWYATGGGLVRVDLKLELYQVFSRAEGLPSTDLTSLLILPDSRLLAGTSDRGVILSTKGAGRWANSGVFDGVPHEHVYCLALSDSSLSAGTPSVWIGTLRGARKFTVGPYYIEPERGSSIILAELAVYDIAEDAEGSVFFATSSGVWRMDAKGDFTRYGTEEGLSSLSVPEVETGPDGRIYIASETSLMRFAGQGFEPVQVLFAGSVIRKLRLLELSGVPVLAAAVGERLYFLDSALRWTFSEPFPDRPTVIGPLVPGTGAAAVGTAKAGIYWPLAGGGYRSLVLPGPLYNVLTRVEIDSRGTVWTSSASPSTPRWDVGVNRYDGKTWTLYTEENSSLLMNMISSVNSAPDGRIYLGTWFGPTVIGSGGFNILDDRGTADPADDRWETYTALETKLSMGVIRGDMAFDSAGGMWVGSLFNQDQPGGLEYFDPVKREFTSYAGQLSERNVQTVEVDGLGNVWIGYLNRGLAVIPGGISGSGGVRDVVSFRNIVGEVGIMDLAVDRVNRLWIATASKVVLLNFQQDAGDESKFAYKEVKPPSFAGLAARAIAFEGVAAAWFATQSGIFRYGFESETDWIVFNRGNSLLASDDVYDIAIDSEKGVLWAATGAGLSAVALSRAAAAGGGTPLLVVTPNPWRLSQQPLLKVSGMPRYSRVLIFTVSGELVKDFEARQTAGEVLFWDGANEHGFPCASGVYLIQASAPGGEKMSGKVALIR
ncbi:MAG TPA: hypothetical protein VM123_05610 [archaeon]|nr:hypothetical protein [archaeon]